MIYPNLVAENQSYMCLEAMARGAEVTPKLMQAVLEGKAELLAGEVLMLSRYMCRKTRYLFSQTLSLLNRNSNRHKCWMQELNQNLYEIWEASKEGDRWATNFMTTNKRLKYVNMSLRFRDGRPVTYAEYMSVKLDMDWTLNLIREKKKKPRGMEW